MSALLLIAALLPGVYWGQGTDTAPALKRAGIERVYVPAARAAEWRQAGVSVIPLDDAARAKYEKVRAPVVEYRMDIASATSMPWVDANGWQFQRKPNGRYWYDLPAGAAPLAAAEGFAYGVDAVLQIQPGDLASLGEMLACLRKMDGPALAPLANIGIIDNGAEELPEVLNLLARRNLLFRIVPAPDPKLDLNVQLGTPQYPAEAASDPGAFAQKIRQQLTDDKRLLRIYGSETTLGYFTGEKGRARLHLLNYGRRGVRGMRVRLRGPYRKATLHVCGIAAAAPAEWLAEGGAVEFTVPEMRVYAVVDLE